MVRGAANRAWAAICGRGGPRSSNGGRAAHTFSEDARRSLLRSGQAISLFSFFLPEASRIVVLAVFHARRDPLVWQARLNLSFERTVRDKMSAFGERLWHCGLASLCGLRRAAAQLGH
jgi:hypothetical protein